MSHYVYMIKCVDDYLYTGITYNVNKRFDEHKSGLCQNTANRLPIKLVYVEKFASIIEAAK